MLDPKQWLERAEMKIERKIHPSLMESEFMLKEIKALRRVAEAAEKHVCNQYHQNPGADLDNALESWRKGEQE